MAAEFLDEIMDKEEITFVLLALLSFQLRISVSIGDGSLKPSAILSHRINIADVYPSMLGTLTMCRRGICGIFYFQYMH